MLEFEKNKNINSNNTCNNSKILIKDNRKRNPILAGIAERAKNRRSQLYKKDKRFTSTTDDDGDDDDDDEYYNNNKDYNYNQTTSRISNDNMTIIRTRGATTATTTTSAARGYFQQQQQQQQPSQHILHRNNDTGGTSGRGRLMNNHTSSRFVTGVGNRRTTPPGNYYVSGRHSRASLSQKNQSRDPNIPVFIYPSSQRGAQQQQQQSLSEKRNMIGEQIYTFIERSKPDLDAGRITGILLELDNYELLNHLLSCPEALDEKIDEVLKVMEDHTHTHTHTMEDVL
jgi:hypothetical protein